MLLQMMQLLAQRVWAKIAPRGEQAICFQVDGKRFSDIRLFTVSKPGNIILTGKLEDQRVKIYEVFSPVQASFIQRVSARPDMRPYFPRVLYGSGRHIVAEWVEGKPLTIGALVTKPELLERFVDMQVALHRQQLAGETSGFDYVRFLEARLHRF